MTLRRVSLTYLVLQALIGLTLLTSSHTSLAIEQEPDMATRYKAANDFGQTRSNLVFDEILGSPQWTDNEHFYYIVKTKRGKEFIHGNISAPARNLVFDQEALATTLSQALNKDLKPYALPIDNLNFSPDHSSVSFTLDNHSFTYSLAEHKITNHTPPSPPPPANPTPPPSPTPESPSSFRLSKSPGELWYFEDDTRPVRSPDGKKEAFIENFNLCIVHLETKEKTILTQDGSEAHYYASSIHWSPDSRYIVCNRITPGEPRYIPIVHSSPEHEVQPKLEMLLYPKAGDKLPERRPTLVNIETKTATLIPYDGADNQFTLYGNGIRWASDSSHFTFDYNQRGHRLFSIYRVNVSTPDTPIPLLTEHSDTFVWYTALERHFLEKNNELLFSSERDGTKQLYLADLASGALKKQLTFAPRIIKRITHIDPDKRLVYLIGVGETEGEDPYLEKHYLLSLDTGTVTCLTPENAWHKVTYSPDYAHCIDSYSRVDLPPVTVLRSIPSGKVLTQLEHTDISSLLAEGHSLPEPFVAKGRDGKTDIYGCIARPRHYDPHKKYPIIENIYAGPHDSFAPKQFTSSLFGQNLTELGFIVVFIDGMGTANRGKAFHDVCYKNIKDAGFPDRIAWMKAAASRYPELDISRVGIFGMSAGGQSSTGAVLLHPDFYKVAVSSCGCHDNRMDKMWWNEAWMGYPVDNAYTENSNVTLAPNLKGKLLLILGEVDSNVDPASTTQVINALVKAKKDFDFLLIPNAGHTFGDDIGERKRRDFFVRHLLNQSPPDYQN